MSATDANTAATIAVDEKSYDLAKFRLTRILNNNTKSKTIVVLGKFLSTAGDDGNEAIVVFEKTAFTASNVNTNDNDNDVIVVANVNDDVNQTSNKTTTNGGGGGGGDNSENNQCTFFSSDTSLKLDFLNDIYGNFECFPKPEINSIKVTIICPCTVKHIQKYTTQAIRITQETPALYETVTVPRLQLEADQFTLDWVYNILDHKKEVERIIFEDPCKELGFILLPDLKWDGKTLETFYAIAIIHKHHLKSLRSLGAEHLPLLRNIRDKGAAAIKAKYNLDRSQLRIYLHYQPSFYHLHVHFTYLKHDAPGIFCERSHLLDTVINNIELIGDYYQKAILSFVLKESDPYCSKYLPAVLATETTGDAKIENETQHNSLSDEPVAKKPKVDG